MKPNVYVYILIMAVVTYLIRMLPMVLVRKEIQNTTIKSFLYYVPYVTLSVMTFPAILSATNSVISAAAGFVVAIAAAIKGFSLFKIAIFACVTVFILEMFI
ncbi:MAG: AzlD domain-containing protein [Clostridiales bacterium]|nr:AzlD domain-containing protein [Clostridiales bacterium]